MNRVDELHHAVGRAVAEQRIGTPVFVRYLVQGVEDQAVVLGRLAQVVAVVRGWVGQAPERLYALDGGGGQVSLMLEFREGATALISFARGEPRGAGVEVMVLGNRGAIYHDAGSGRLWDEEASRPEGVPDREVLAVIEEGLRSGRPVAFGGGWRS